MITKSKVTEIFCIADDFCKEFEAEIAKNSLKAPDGKKHRNRKCQLSDSEIITILICFHFNDFRNFKHYYHSPGMIQIAGWYQEDGSWLYYPIGEGPWIPG